MYTAIGPEEHVYLSISRSRSIEIPRIKGSRFIGDAFPVRTPEHVDSGLKDVRARESRAPHHCYAYRLGVDGNNFRVHDDGELVGTAGSPILRQIDRRELANIMVVVTWYYGGTRH